MAIIYLPDRLYYLEKLQDPYLALLGFSKSLLLSPSFINLLSNASFKKEKPFEFITINNFCEKFTSFISLASSSRATVLSIVTVIASRSLKFHFSRALDSNKNLNLSCLSKKTS